MSLFPLYHICCLFLYSNACVGGSSTAASMADRIGRLDLLLPATLVGLLGYVIGTPAGLGLARVLGVNRGGR